MSNKNCFFRFVLASIAVPFSLLAGDFKEEWPQWRGMNRDGVYAGGNLPSQFESAGWNLAWTAELKESYSSPVADTGYIYTTESVGGNIERAMAYDRKTGKRIWETSWEAGMKVPFFARSNGSWIRSTPIVHEDRLICHGHGRGFGLFIEKLRRSPLAFRNS